MLACEKCGHVFDEDEAIHGIEYTGVTSEGWSEKFEVTKCPECGEDWVTEAHRCNFCGDWSLNDVCDDCKSYISRNIKTLVECGMTLHRANNVKPNKFDIINAINEVMEDI